MDPLTGFLLSFALMIVGELLRPKPKFEDPKPSSLGDFGFPTAQEGRSIPIAWGRAKIAGPNVTWYGDLKVVPIKKKQKTGLFSSKKVTVGYKYYLGVQHAILFGYLDDFISMTLDDKAVELKGKTTTADTIVFTMDQPELFGAKDQEGGVTGTVRVYRGSFTQTANAYMASKIGVSLPGYRPVAQVIFEGCYLGNSGRLPPPEFVIDRRPNPLGLTSNRHNINGDANPMNMIYEIMTDRLWGMGISSALIDTASFITAANTLAAEGLGLSMVVDSAQTGEQLISEILRHVDGVTYTDYATGQIKVALVRDDYNIATLPVVDESVVLTGTFEFSRGSWEDTQNTVKIKYLDRDQNFTERVIQHQDLANISTRGGSIEAEEYDFLGISNAAAANRIAARVLQTVACPLSRITFNVNRTVTSWARPGAVFKMQWQELGLEQVIYRISEVDYGTIDDPAIKISAVEDIFSVAEIAYETPNPSGWIDPVTDPQPVAAQALVEAPYALVGENRMLLSVATRAGGQDLGYRVYADQTGGTTYTLVGDSPGFTPSGTLVSGYGASTDSLDNTGFLIASVDGIEDLEAVTSAQLDGGQNLLLIDDEVMAWTSVEDAGSGQWHVKGVLQGVLDTVPATHAAGARVWFLTDGYAQTSAEPYTSNVTPRVKLPTYTSRKELPIASAVAMTETITQRAWKPYPAASLKVDGSATAVNVTGNATVTWAIRDRLVQKDALTVVAQSAASVTAAPEHTYDLKVYIGGVLKRTVNITAAPFDTYDYTTAMRTADDANTAKLVKFGVVAKRGAFTSVERFTQEIFMLDVATPISVTTTTLADGLTETPYSQALVAAGGSEPYTWDITSGTLPAGLSLSSAGIISGTPTVAGAQTFTVRVQGPIGNQATKALTLTVAEVSIRSVDGGDTRTTDAGDTRITE